VPMYTVEYNGLSVIDRGGNLLQKGTLYYLG